MEKTSFDLNLLIGGEAGQGMQTVGMLLTRILLSQGYYISTLQSYQSRIRGGHNYFQIRIADHPIHSMTRRPDIILAFDQATLDIHAPELSEQGIFIFNTDRSQSPSGASSGQALLSIPVHEIFPEAQKQEVLGTSVFLGALGSVFGLPFDVLSASMEQTLGKKGPEIIEKNRQAIQAGMNLAKTHAAVVDNRFVLPAAAKPTRYLSVHGNEALAIGAIAAQCRFYSAYPMTPSSSILDTLAHFMRDTGMVVEQAEDEIAALNMVLGASYAGARAATGTSGGGFALMVEALSLAGMTETPAVIFLAQRPGPATGLPTRTEQGDLAFAVYAGHGEFPRAILAPGTHSECFELAAKAFDLADGCQTPIIVMTDQYLADWYTNVLPFAPEKITPDRGKLVESAPDYVRYALTEDGISPRALPGRGRGLVIVDSDEHTPDGHLTEDLEVRQKMTDKRSKKEAYLLDAFRMPQIIGEGKEFAVLCWGSNYGVCLDSVRQYQQQGIEVSLVHFSQVWPLPGQRLRELHASYRNLIMVENNATGQFARLLHEATSIEIRHQVRKYNGLPFYEEELSEALGRIFHG